ncbi:PstS family phosphate ABC transporter substrate-binding protein [Nonomuraea sediminis]|uniref:PstS family phosphate ABC transporter substrate-binding protein n=1 Tax=Nonomuraea sediminis TaxID=2835864 RepID=UPI001BDC9E1C|nr:substrate-binding domain-containing protein [Nonomuraea sediminis]
MAALQLLGELVDFLGGVGPVLFGIILLLVTPFVDRLLVRRKRISFRVLYNSKIGLGPEKYEPAESDPPQLRRLTTLLERMSIVVIRIRNSGSYDIDDDDFDRPLSFTFGGRVVWNARVSEATTDHLRTRLRNGLRFFTTANRPSPDSLQTVRGRLGERMARWLLGGQAQQDNPEPAWHGVRMEDLALKRGQRAKLVVVLREEDPTGEEITKVVEHTGKLRDTGMIKDEGRTRRVTLPRVSGALVIVLTALLVLSQLAQPRDKTVACASGTLRIEGSSVFMDAMRAVAEEYMKACGDATITTNANGSLGGVRDVATAGSGDLVALSDGRSRDYANLYAEKLAIVVYYVVVNSGVGVTTLSVKDLQRINSGAVNDWRRIRGGDPLPIRIVSRGGDSGTRQLYEQRVLGTGENVLSSSECLTRDRNAGVPIIRCERGDNAKVIQQVSTTPGAIGYADAQSLAEARRAGTITALTLDGRAFDASTAVESGYPFWTVEYLYTRAKPQPGSLAADFLAFAHNHPLARGHLTESGFRPCATAEGTLPLCDLR